eukprot:TRINITY_DN60772_c0_g1_i1.p2 TRINITY_DN60772_c0_g1~~TRINITY_DN60772_c0_g1_i1.p2  ORF type:complete len:141 (+),score=15.91 TRINITY_DN60772_c0_g1_i1:69-491(+)
MELSTRQQTSKDTPGGAVNLIWVLLRLSPQLVGPVHRLRTTCSSAEGEGAAESNIEVDLRARSVGYFLPYLSTQCEHLFFARKHLADASLSNAERQCSKEDVALYCVQCHTFGLLPLPNLEERIPPTVLSATLHCCAYDA